MTKSDGQALYCLKLTPGMAFLYGPEGKQAHAQAIELDRDKSYRMVMNIVGKVCQGKTSLLRLLVGDDFNEHEISTVGIDHELVDTLGGTLNEERPWSKVDLRQANADECDLIVGKHVRERLVKRLKGKHYKSEVKSFLKALILTYFMMFLYFTMAETSWTASLPWFPVMLAASFAFSGIVLFDSLRDGFAMAVGVLCLVVYADSLIRWRLFTRLAIHTGITMTTTYAFCYYAIIHAVMAFCMGLSVGMGICFVMCLTTPPWQPDLLQHSIFLEAHVHTFAISILIGIWSVRHPKLLASVTIVFLVIANIIPESFVFTIISGLGCGFAHAIFIKFGFDAYVKFVNPLLKLVAEERRNRRFICYTFGIFPGIFFCQFFEWRLSQSWLLHGIGGLMFVAVVEFLHAFLEGRVTAAPKPAFKNATKVLNSTTKVSLKFVIRDFAGHPLYHSVHHVYMMGHCVYLIVFNFLDAKRNFNSSFTDVLYWLQAIMVHGRYPNVRALIIGTHRDHSRLSADDIEELSDKLKTALPRQFYNIVVWNGLTGKPVFPVENSLRHSSDIDHCNLRKELFRIAEEAMELKYPIKYFYFYRVINECRDRGRLIETLANIRILCDRNECSITQPGELEELLNYFQSCGEIIHNAYDNNQNQLVVMDPKALVKIMANLVRVAPRYDRKAEFLVDWNTVADLGICTKRLLHHIIRTNSHVSEEVDTNAIISMLETLDLACKLDLGPDGRDVTGEECYLLVPLLKDILPYPQNYWEDNGTDCITYFDFGPVVPKFIFSRLVCQCASESNIEVGPTGNYHINVSTSKALFVESNRHSYKLELLNKCIGALPSQQLLKLVIRGADRQGCMQFVRAVCQKVNDIVVRDFRTCRYRIGVMCPFKDEHDYCQQGEHHILPLFESIKSQHFNVEEPRRRLRIPDNKKYWCRGRPVHFRYGQVVIGQGSNTGRVAADMHNQVYSMSVIDLPPRLYSDVCDDLNLDNIFGKDWTELAGKLGYTKRDVDILKFRSPRDPCDALLQDWTTSSTEPTVLTLIKLLTEINRLDVVGKLEQFIHVNYLICLNYHYISWTRYHWFHNRRSQKKPSSRVKTYIAASAYKNSLHYPARLIRADIFCLRGKNV